MTFEIKRSITRKIFDLLTPAERRNAVVLLVLMCIGMVLETLGVGLVIPAIAVLTKSDLAHNYSALQPVLHKLDDLNQQTLVIGSMLVLVSVYLIKVMFLAYLAWRQARFAFGVQEQLSQRLFTVYLRQPYVFHLQWNSARLISNVINEVDMLVSSVILPSLILLAELLVLLGLCSLLLIVEPLGALIVVSIVGAASWGFYRFARKHIVRWGQLRQYHEGLRLQHLQQGLGGAKEVNLLGREADFLEQYRVHNAWSTRGVEMQSTLKQLPRLWLELLAVIGLAMLVISMIALNRALETVLPTLTLFAAAAFRLIPSVNKVLGAVQSLRYGIPAVDTLHTELKLVTKEMVATRSLSTLFQALLELSHVTYTYPGVAKSTLNDISLTIHRGEMVGIIGASGGGKSTLVDILLGLLTPDAGELRVDGKDIQGNLRNWQDQIGYVPQSIFLTDDTLRRNVAFGLANEQIDDTAVQRAVKAAQLEEFVASLPERLETLVGERGIRLSGGQRQRIGIARALYHDPALLVLDEATSALDTTTEHDVMQSVLALQGTRTIIIVAHRLSTVEHCDRLYQIEMGRVVKDGLPCEVLPYSDKVDGS